MRITCILMYSPQWNGRFSEAARKPLFVLLFCSMQFRLICVFSSFHTCLFLSQNCCHLIWKQNKNWEETIHPMIFTIDRRIILLTKRLFSHVHATDTAMSFFSIFTAHKNSKLRKKGIRIACRQPSGACVAFGDWIEATKYAFSHHTHINSFSRLSVAFGICIQVQNIRTYVCIVCPVHVCTHVSVRSSIYISSYVLEMKRWGVKTAKTYYMWCACMLSSPIFLRSLCGERLQTEISSFHSLNQRRCWLRYNYMLNYIRNSIIARAMYDASILLLTAQCSVLAECSKAIRTTTIMKNYIFQL